MAVPTVVVTCNASDQGGKSVAFGEYTAKLDQTEIYAGFVVPEVVNVTANAEGVALMNLWPNALGVNGSSYRITARNPDTGRKFFDASVVVPNLPCNLYQIIQSAPFPNIDSAQQALISVQALVAIANQDVLLTDDDRVAAEIAAAQALTRSAKAALSEVAADGSADGAEISAALALTRSADAALSKLASVTISNDLKTNWSDKLATASSNAAAASASAGQAVTAKNAAEAARDTALANTATFAAPGGAGLVGWVQSGIGAVFRWVRDKLRETISVQDFGAVGDGVTDDSIAVGKAIAWATTPVFGIMCRSLLWPSGKYLVTQNNWLGANMLTASYGGLIDTVFMGQGRNSSVIVFKPTVANAACYDQSLTPNTPLIGFTFNDLGVVFDNSANGNGPIHFIKSVAVANKASQNFKLSNVTMTGVNGSILFILAGTVNEDLILGHNVRLVGFKSVIECASNVEALLHHFYHLDLIAITGDAFNYTKGGSLAVYGCNAIMEGTAGVDTAVLRIGGGVTSQTYHFSSLRTELRGARTRALIISKECENNITFESCNLFPNIPNNQAWALAPVQHHSSIVFSNCILPVRTGVGVAGSFLLSDSTSGFDYAQDNYAQSKISFINCNPDGSRLIEQEGWVNFSALTSVSANFRTIMVSYVGCGGLADSVAYGGVFRQGRTFVQKAPPKLIFRGNNFPAGNGTTAASVSVADFNVIVPLNNFLTEIVVMRSALATAATLYQIEFIDTAERTTPGSGVVFGFTTAKANNLAIFERVPIVRQFNGTLAQRTIWARMKAGYTLGESVGTPIEGGIYAEVL